MERQPKPTVQEQTTAADFEQWENDHTSQEPEIMTTPNKTEGITDFAVENTPGMGTGLEHVPEAPVSPTAELIRRASDRITGMLDKRAETKDERAEARAETIKNGKEKLRQIGNNALTGAKEFSVIAVSAAFLAAENGVNTTTNYVHNKVVAYGVKAQTRRNERAARKEEAMRTIRNRDEVEALAMNKRYDEETEAMNMNEQFDQHTEALAMNDQYDLDKKAEAEKREKRLEALAKAKAAYARKMERRDRRRAQFDTAKEKGGLLYEKAKRGVKRFGRAAVRTFVRARRAGAAAREAWNQA